MNHQCETANCKGTFSGTQGLLPSRIPDENLNVSDSKRILCTALRVDQHQMFLAAFGPEQTKIVYTFVEILSKYDGLNIRGVSTSRSDCAAGSYIMLGDISGTAASLVELGRAIQFNPWFEPVGTNVVPATVIDLKIIAPARHNSLLNALTVVSGEYGINIESMVHRTYHSPFDHGFDLLRRRGTGAGFAGGTPTKKKGLGRKTSRGDKTRGRASKGEMIGLEMGGLRVDDFSGNESDFISITQMRLELPEGTNLKNLKRDLERVGTHWELRWEERHSQGRFNLHFTKKLCGGLN